jgi:sugar lactone lactonase YvrE
MKAACLAAALMLGATTAALSPAWGASDVTVTEKMAFPESLTSTQDGTLYIGSMNLGALYRAAPGAATATTFISREAGGFGKVLGVLADQKSNTLWVCDNDGARASLKTFALRSGAKMKQYDLPGGGFCNDIALKGTDAYITDTKGGRVLKLAKGADALTVWYTNDAADPSLDGLVWKSGVLYTNTYNGNHLIRITAHGDGSADKATVLATSMDIFQPDGLRLAKDGTILMVEGRGKDGNGRLDAVTVSGDAATIKVIKDKYMLPTAVTTVGDTAYVLEAKLNYQRDPALKDKDPGTFTAYAVPLK